MIEGLVTTSTVLTHPVLIARLFGVACLLRCVAALALGHRTTFLALAVGSL